LEVRCGIFHMWCYVGTHNFSYFRASLSYGSLTCVKYSTLDIL
jgi:hypothetical protein